MQRLRERQGEILVARPNWVAPVNEVFEYLTEVFVTSDGSEYRHSHRQMPRISMAYRSDMFDALSAAFHGDYWTQREDRSFVAPCRWRYVELTADLDSGSSAITVSGDVPWWAQEGAALVLESRSQHEVCAIASVAAGVGDFTITLEAATTFDFLAGDLLMLGYWVHYPERLALDSLVNTHRRASTFYLADPGKLPEWVLPATPRAVYRGFDIIPPRHNWRFSLSAELRDMRETVDYGRGVPGLSWDDEDRQIVENRVHTALDRDQADQLVQDFMRHKGMRRPFWTTSPVHRFPPLALPTSSGSRLLYTAPGAFADRYADDNVFRYVWVQWPDGAMQINRILSHSTATYDTVTCQDDFQRAIPVDGFVGWAILSRFASDKLELTWFTDTACQANLPVKSLRSDWVETKALAFSTEIPRLETDPAGEWTDSGTYDEFDLLGSGANPDLLATGGLTFVAEWEAKTFPTAPNTWVARLEVAFYDSSGTQIETHSDTGSQFKGSDTAVRNVTVEIEEPIPANTATVRYRMIANRPFEAPQKNYAGFQQRQWGAAASGGLLKWV